MKAVNIIDFDFIQCYQHYIIGNAEMPSAIEHIFSVHLSLIG